MSIPANTVKFGASTPSPAALAPALSVRCELENSKADDRGKKGEVAENLSQLTHTHRNIVGLFPPERKHVYVGLKKIDFTERYASVPLSTLKLVRPSKKTGGKTHAYYFPGILAGLQVAEKFAVDQTTLLPSGNFELELHGTKYSLNVKSSKPNKSISLTSLVGNTPQIENKKISKDQFYFLNKAAELKFGEDYLVFPGQHTLSFAGNEKTYPATIQPGQNKHSFTVDAITVMQNCPPWELECKHHKKFALFHKGKRYPFARGISESFLYYVGEQNLEIANLGTFALRKQISPKTKVIKEKVGSLKVDFIVEQNDYKETEFVRIEPARPDMSGASFDLSFIKTNKLTMFTGKYVVAQYTYNRRTKKRRRIVQNIQVGQNEKNKVTVKIFRRNPRFINAALKTKPKDTERMRIF